MPGMLCACQSRKTDVARSRIQPMKPQTDVKTQREKQAGKVAKLYAYLSEREGQWVPLPELSRAIGSECGSTKISQARAHAKQHGEVIEWNRDPNASAYMLRRERLGRDASEVVASPWDQDRPFGEMPFRLTPPE